MAAVAVASNDYTRRNVSTSKIEEVKQLEKIFLPLRKILLSVDGWMDAHFGPWA